MPTSHSLTLTSNVGLLRALETACHICPGFDPAHGGQLPATHPFQAIWDTGATGSVITQQVIDACSLQPIAMTIVHGVHGSKEAEVFLVNIGLPNRIMFANVTVTKGELIGNAQVLIGMDIITQGDFSITNKDSKTIFSFRIPSEHHVDYVKEHNEKALREQFHHGGSTKNRKKPKKHGKKGKRHGK